MTFEIFIDDDRYSVPTLAILVLEDEAAARTWAALTMAESPHHMGVEVCFQGERLFGLGSCADTGPSGGDVADSTAE